MAFSTPLAAGPHAKDDANPSPPARRRQRIIVVDDDATEAAERSGDGKTTAELHADDHALACENDHVLACENDHVLACENDHVLASRCGTRADASARSARGLVAHVNGSALPRETIGERVSVCASPASRAVLFVDRSGVAVFESLSFAAVGACPALAVQAKDVTRRYAAVWSKTVIVRDD